MKTKITGFFQMDEPRSGVRLPLVVSTLPPLKDDLEPEMEEGLSTFRQDGSLANINNHKCPCGTLAITEGKNK